MSPSETEQTVPPRLAIFFPPEMMTPCQSAAGAEQTGQLQLRQVVTLDDFFRD